MRRKILTVFLISMFLLNVIPFIPSASASPDWLTGWSYRKSHVINASAGAGTNYQVKVVAYFGSGTDSAQNVYLNNHAQSDFDDVRFTSSDGTTLLDYYRETYTLSDLAWFWVEIADSLSSSSVTIYLYYGKSDASTTSHLLNTMLWGDDVETGSLNNWDGSSGWSAQSTNPAQGSYYAQDAATFNLYKNHDIEDPAYPTFAVEWNWRNPSSSGWINFAERHDASPNQLVSVWMWGMGGNDQDIMYYYGAGSNSKLYDGFKDTWYKFKLYLMTDHYDLYLYSLAGAPITGVDAVSYGTWFIPTYDVAFVSGDSVGWMDAYFIRKYVDPEPAHGAWGTESMSSGFVLTLPDLDAGEWVFAQEKFYTFNLTGILPEGVAAWDFLSLSFLDGAEQNCTVLFDVGSGQFTVTSGSDYIRISQVSGQPVQIDSVTFSVDFEIWFTDKITDAYALGVDVWAWGNYTGGSIKQKPGNEAFKIYNRGGFSPTYESSNFTLAHRLAGGDVFEFYAEAAPVEDGRTWVYSDYMWRNLQHIKQLVDIRCRVGYPTFHLHYGMDFYTEEDGWLHGWELDFGAINITVPRAMGVEANWWWSAVWYYNDVYIKTDYVVTFPEGNPAVDGDYAQTRFWLDLWFNRVNASSTWGGRVNSYYYPVKDNADPWLRMLSTNWGPDDKKPKESLTFGRLRKADGSILQTQQIVMVRTWSNVSVYNDATYIQKLTQFHADVMDLTVGKTPLEGIQTPAFDETKMPSLQTGGFLGLLFSGFSWIGKWLSENIVYGGLNLWGVFVGFLDSIAGWFGAPHFFSDLFTWIGDGITYMVSSANYLFQLLTQFFLLIGSLLSSFIDILTQLVTALINTITGIQNIMSGAVGAGGNLWVQLGISTWITLALIFYPLYLVYLWESDGMEAVLTQLGWIWGIAAWLVGFFIQIIQTVIGFITSLLESVPVAE